LVLSIVLSIWVGEKDSNEDEDVDVEDRFGLLVAAAEEYAIRGISNLLAIDLWSD
jgi:hypothetical protein